MNALIESLNEAGAVFGGFAGRMLVQSAVLVVVLYGLDRLLRGRVRASIRYGIWLLVLVKLLLPTGLSFPTGAGYWLGRATPVRNAAPALLPAFTEGQDSADASPPASFLSWLFPMQQDRSPLDATEQASALPPSLGLPAVLLMAWLAGASTLGAAFLIRLVCVRRLVRKSRAASPRCQGILRRSAALTGLRVPALRECDRLGGPAVCGLFRPTVLMPAGLEDRLTDEQLETILLHELCHIQRGDLWINLVQTLLQIIYFYNPFVWLANGCIRRVREQANDERVLVYLDGRRECYHHTLIDVAAAVFRRPPAMLRLIGVMETRNQLNERIKLMIQRPIPTTTRLGWTGTLAIVLLGGVLLPMARGQSAPADPLPPPAAPARSTGVAVRPAPAAALTSTEQALIDEYDRMTAELVRSVNEGNVNRMVSLFADNAILLPASRPPAVGARELIDYYVGFFRDNPGLRVLDVHSDRLDVWTVGDLVFAVEEYSLSFKTAAMRYVMTDYQKSISILRRQPDGSLRMVVTADNSSPVPLDPGTYQARTDDHPRVTMHATEAGALAGEPMAQAVETVKALDREFEQCFIRGDTEAAIGVYAPQAMMLTINQETIRGGEAISEHIRASAGRSMIDNDQAILDAGGADGMIYIVNRFNWQFRDPANPEQIHAVPGKGLHVWQRQPDGQWKILLDIHNTSIPLPEE